MMPKQKRRQPGRPPKPMPDPILDTPENVARALMTSPPRKPDDWDYLKADATAKDAAESR